MREGERVDEREGVREGEREKVGDRRGIGAVTMAAPISKKRKVRRHIHRNAEGKKERKRNETSKERNHVGCERVLRKKKEWKRNKERNEKKYKAAVHPPNRSVATTATATRESKHTWCKEDDESIGETETILTKQVRRTVRSTPRVKKTWGFV